MSEKDSIEEETEEEEVYDDGYDYSPSSTGIFLFNIKVTTDCLTYS